MTIALSANTPRISYTVSQGVTQTSFAVPFVFFTGSTDLNVFVDNVARTFDASTSNTSLFTVSGGNGSTGTVTTSVTGATGGSTVVITRAIPLSRTTDFPSSGAFEISKLNTELDTVTAIQSDFNDSASRAIRLQDSDSAVSMELPLLASRKGTVLGFNATTGAAEAGPTIANVSSLADITANISTVAGISANVTTVAGISSNVTTVAGIASSVTAVAGKTSEITALANSDVIADMALLGTSDVIADMALLANADVISDMNTLAVTDVINDINTLATSDIVADLNTLATSDIVSDINTLATSDIVSDLNTLATSDIVSDINTLATSDIVSDLNLLATSDFVSDLNTMATTANVNNLSTVATNITGINSFVERYRVGSSEPTSDNDAGDLFFNTTTNELRAFNGSTFQATSPSAASQTNINIVAGEITSTEDLGSITESIDTSSGNNIDTVANNITNVNTVGGISANVTTVAGISSNVTTVAGVASNVTTVASNITGVNSFAERYRVASSAPTSSLDAGDLYFNTSTNTLNYYNGSSFVAVVAGAMTSLAVDTTPQLGGNLDVNGNSIVSASNGDITIAPNGSGEINLNGTVNTDNLTIDFGSIA